MDPSFPPKLYFSTRAYSRLLLEVAENFHTETGGILLGLEQDGGTYVTDILDPGPGAVLEPAYFEYDYKYLTHLANKVALRYKRPIRLLGLWHRHPGSYDTFSSLDHRTNSTYAQICGGKAVSGLVNLDPHFRMTFFQVTGKGRSSPDRPVLASYQDEKGSTPASVKWNPKKGYKTGAVVLYRRMRIYIGDGHFPPGILDQKTPRELEEEIRNKAQGALAREKKNLAQKIASKVVPKAKPLPDPTLSERLLQAVESDLLFLEEQPDYSYQLQVHGNRLLVHMVRVTQMAGYPPELRLDFLIEGETPYLETGGARYPYRPGILKAMIDQALAMGPEFGPEPDPPDGPDSDFPEDQAWDQEDEGDQESPEEEGEDSWDAAGTWEETPMARQLQAFQEDDPFPAEPNQGGPAPGERKRKRKGDVKGEKTNRKENPPGEEEREEDRP